jgi:WD40 repeat protein/serine/threonine protein kinase
MDQLHDKAVKEIFLVALDKIAGTEREAYLAQACGRDEALRKWVEVLLEEHAHAGDFLQDSPFPALESADQHALSPTEKPGDSIGPYKLLQEIGEGGCGVVYLAEQHEPLRRAVALKIIKLGMDTRRVIARFEAERQALALMDHPNIAKVFDAGATETGRPYFVMELVRGIKITDYCDEHQLSTEERLALFVQICHAIQHAHQKGIIHRDIKPSNILVTRMDGQPVPKVIDFGIAKATGGEVLTDKTIFTAFEQFIGTPAYMSPEQAELSGQDIDTRSDIYGLGVLLYELLTGRTPFEQKDLLAAGLEEMRRIISQKEPARPSTRLSTLTDEEKTTVAQRRQVEPPQLIHMVRGDLDWIVMKCIEKDRRRRYESANGLAEEVARHLRNEPVAARPPNKIYRMQKFVRRNRILVTAGILLAGALVLGATVSIWQALRASRLLIRAEQNERRALMAQVNEEEQKLRARRQAYAADMSLANQALTENDLGLARRLLEEHRPRPGEADLRDWEWRYVWQGCRSDARSELCRYSNSVHSAAFAPDGKTLALAGFFQTQEFVDLWNVQAGRPRKRLQEDSGQVVAFAPCAELLATGGRDGKIALWNTTAASPLGYLSLTSTVMRLKFSPDGTKLAALSLGGGVFVWDARHREALMTRPVKVFTFHYGAIDFQPDGKSLVVGDSDPDSRGRITSWDIGTGHTNFIITNAHSEPITAVACSANGVIATGSGYSSGQIRLWSGRSGKYVGVLEGHTSWISELIFSADGQRLFSASADQTIRVWDISEARCLDTLRGNDELWTLALSPDGATLVSGSKDGMVSCWDSVPSKRKDPEQLTVYDGFGSIAFSPDSRTMAASRAGTVVLVDLADWGRVRTLPDLGTNINIVAYSPDGAWLSVGDQKGRIHVWSDAESRVVAELEESQERVIGLGFRANGARLFSINGSFILTWWDRRDWSRCGSFALDPQVSALAISPSGQLMAAGIFNGLAWLNGATGEVLGQNGGHRQAVEAVSFSPDGTKLASAGNDGSVSLWDAATFKLISVFKGHTSSAHGIRFSPDMRRLVTSGSTHDSVKLWDLSDLSSHRELICLRGEGSMFSVLGFSPDGKWLAARDDISNRLNLWHAPSWAEIEVFEKGRTSGL